MAGEALWDKDNAVGPPASAPPPPSVPLLKPLAAHLRFTAEFTGFRPCRRPCELRSRVGGTLTPSAFRKRRLVSRGQPRCSRRSAPVRGRPRHRRRAIIVRVEVRPAVRRRISIAFNDWSPAAPYHVKTLTMSPPRVRATGADAIGQSRCRRSAPELSPTRITAPIAGRVDRIPVTRGNLVSGGVAGNATPDDYRVSQSHVCVLILTSRPLKALRHTRSDKNPPVVNMGLTTDNGCLISVLTWRAIR